MESKIITLPEDLVSKIAAGEVVERPASCVKELVENSIDAGAERVTIEIKGAGIPEIKVSDDGEGMAFEELELAVRSHTTSKLRSESDLWEIKHLGFRGEALPSICQVAEVEILSRPKVSKSSNYIKVKGGEILEHREVGRDIGTTVIVRNLFYNVPVRRKFLKSETTELRHIIFAVQRLALAYTDVSFSLSHNGNKIFDLPKQSLSQRIEVLFNKSFADTLQLIEHKTDLIEVSGYLSRPYITEDVVQQQFIFVNKRPCRERITRKAVENAYGVPLRERKISFILFVNTPPDFVDVNVHPRKDEVRFRNENLVYNVVLQSVSKGLGIKIFPTPGKGEEKELELEDKVFWQFHNSYIFAPTTSGVLIIDQHAAHERVLYEKVLKEPLVSQKLLFPEIVRLTLLEEKIFNEFKAELQKSGFEIEEFGEQTVRVIAMPSVIKDFTANLFKSMLLELEELGKLKDNRFSAVATMVACKSAVKSGNPMSQEEMKALVESLFAAELPYFCPHGRPTFIRMTERELEHKFRK